MRFHALWCLTVLAIAAKADNTCPGYDPADPYSMNIRFSEGPNEGKCLNLAKNRPAHILNANEALPYAPERGEVVIANFWHQGKYWIAKFPVNSIQKIIAHKEYFDPGSKTGALLNRVTGFSAHFQNRFRTFDDKPVTLYKQTGSDYSPQQRIRNVVFSAEAIMPANDGSFDIFRGFENRFAISMRVTSLQEKIRDMVVDQQHHVDQMPIKPLTNKSFPGYETAEKVRQKYLKAFLENSESDYQAMKAGHPMMYDTDSVNCVSKGKDPYDKVNNPLYNDVQKKLEDPKVKFNPMFIRQGLKARGMLNSILGIAAPNYIDSLEKEFKKTKSYDP
jgi:hypothetical protein